MLEQRTKPGMMSYSRVVCEAPDQPMRPLDEHCYKLACILSTSASEEWEPDCPEWNQARGWLDLASGVKRVEIITGLLDECSRFCGTAAEYEDARSQAVSDYYTELTRFLFTWGAFETAVEAVKPPDWRNGKIRAVGRFLARRFDPDKLIHYRCAVSRLKQSGIKDSDFSPDGGYGESGIGIRVVYKLRNRLSHGSLEFPEPEDWGGSPRLDTTVARLATRIVLLTIQMMLITHFAGTSVLIKYRDNSKEDSDEMQEEAQADTCAIGSLLREIHVNRAIDVVW